MGLTASLNNALSGMRLNQHALEIVSRNTANAGTPGYHRQSLSSIDNSGTGSGSIRGSTIVRAFDRSLQAFYTSNVSDAASASVEARYLDQLQSLFGRPGAAGSLDTVFKDFQNSLSALAVSPDDAATRGTVLGRAQGMVETLNRLSSSVQDMRLSSDQQIAQSVRELNSMLASLGEVNQGLLDQRLDDAGRATLSDQRDRLVASIAEKIDVKVDYRADNTVALMTRAGIGLIDREPSILSFEGAGHVGATAAVGDSGGLGSITITTPGNLRLDLVKSGALQGGELGGLIKLRDQTLVSAQSQLDEVAAALAQALSTEVEPGTPVTRNGVSGLSYDIGRLAPGNDMMLTLDQGGMTRSVRIVNTAEPLDYVDAQGVRVLGADMSQGPAGVAARLSSALPGVGVEPDRASGLAFFGDGGTIGVTGLSGRRTVTGPQEGLGVNLFVDVGGTPFTNALDGAAPQKRGFASRIALNPAITADSRLLVQASPGQTLGDSVRPTRLLEQLKSMQFVSGLDPRTDGNAFRFAGSTGQVISQVIAQQGTTVAAALARRDERMVALEAVDARMQSANGVNVDEEMARLIEVQNAYAANARVISTVKELIDRLLAV